MIVSSYLSVSKTWIFLCYWVTTFPVFSISLSLYFFPKVQKLRCTLYTGAHYMVHKCWLVRKRKTGYFRHQFIETQWEAKYIIFSTEGWTFFFLFIEKVLEKSYLYCFGVPNNYNPKFPNREYADLPELCADAKSHNSALSA